MCPPAFGYELDEAHRIDDVYWTDAPAGGPELLVVSGEWTGRCGMSRQTVFAANAPKLISAKVVNSGSCPLQLSGILLGNNVFFTDPIAPGESIELDGCVDWVLAYCDEGRERCAFEYRARVAQCR